MSDDIITTDQPLSPSQQQNLSALADTLLPASAESNMPSAGELDLIGHLNTKGGEPVPRLLEILQCFDNEFASLPLLQRVDVVGAFSNAQPEAFDWLLFEVYDCYYQNSHVLTGIGLAAGPPFPRGMWSKQGICRC